MAVANAPDNQKTAIPYRDPVPGTVYETRLKGEPLEPPADLDTLSKNFLYQVRKLNDKIAMRKKRYGLWQEYTWQDVYEHVSDFAMGLVSLGLSAGEAVCIIGENDPEMYWTQMAAHAMHVKTTCIFSDATPRDIVYAVTSAGATFLVAHDQEQVDKALEIQAQIPDVRRVIYWDDKGMWGYDDNPWLSSFESIEALGREYKKSHADLFEKSVAETQADDVIILSMTSGTTSLPKFSMSTNWQLVYGSYMNYDYLKVTKDDNWLSFSPMAWMTEQAFGFAPHLLFGMQINFPESAGTVPVDMREIAPAGLLFPSRVWENLASQVRFRINDSTLVNRRLYERFMPIAYKVIDLEDAGKEIPGNLKLLRQLGEVAVFQPLRDKLGLVNARNVLTAGAMLSPDVIRFFRAIGVELRQLYASTETFATIHLPGDVKLGTVGVIVPGVQIKIAENGEILVKTEAQFAGYYNNPEKTGEALDTEGWYYTGDAGYINEDGHLIYLERVKDMIELGNGQSYSPQYIEGRLKFSPYIQDIMTVGGSGRDFVTAIIVIDFENVARHAEKRGMSFTTMVDLSQKDEIADLIREDIVRVNRDLPDYSRVHRFVIMHKEFDADEGELTRTRKLRRGILEEKYSDILDAMYGGKSGSINVRAEVKYRDGRQGVVETELQVRDV